MVYTGECLVNFSTLSPSVDSSNRPRQVVGAVVFREVDYGGGAFNVD